MKNDPQVVNQQSIKHQTGGDLVEKVKQATTASFRILNQPFGLPEEAAHAISRDFVRYLHGVRSCRSCTHRNGRFTNTKLQRSSDDGGDRKESFLVKFV